MVRWKVDQLIARYEQATGEPLRPTFLMREAGLSTSTVYAVIRGEPSRIGLKSIDALLTFFSRYLGVLTVSDLLEFELEELPAPSFDAGKEIPPPCFTGRRRYFLKFQ